MQALVSFKSPSSTTTLSHEASVAVVWRFFQMLRKAMLEMILRTSALEPVKNLTKDIQKQMMRIIVLENEENAILAIKIVIDHCKIARSHMIPEVGEQLVLG